MARYWLTDPISVNPLAGFDEMRRSLEEAYGRLPFEARASRVFPPLNLYESGDGVVLTAELPGLSADDIDISVEGNRLTLSGERRIEHPADAGRHRLERTSGGFRRVIELPAGLDASKAEAVCKHGVLLLRIPKSPESQPRRISVKAS